MTKRTYVCNVCRSEFPPKTGDVFGFNFKSVSFGGDFWESSRPDNCENHICAACLDNAVVFHREIRAKQIKEGSL